MLLNGHDPLVDDFFYDQRNADVRRTGLDPAEHYHQFGAKEGRDPDAFFSTKGYLSANPDVTRVGIDPLEH